MLGKGLESLIPQKGSSTNSDQTNAVPQKLPPHPVILDLPDVEVELELPAYRAEMVEVKATEFPKIEPVQPVPPPKKSAELKQRKDEHRASRIIFSISE